MPITATQLKSIFTNPTMIGSLIGVGTGFKAAKTMHFQTIMDDIAHVAQENRLFYHFKDLGVKSGINTTQEMHTAVQALKGKVGDITKYRVVPHVDSEVFELIPTGQEFIDAYNNMNKFEKFKEIASVAKAPIAANIAVAGVTGATIKYGPGAVDAIKKKIAESKVTKEATDLIKDEIEKRACQSNLDKVASSTDINTLLTKYASKY